MKTVLSCILLLAVCAFCLEDGYVSGKGANMRAKPYSYSERLAPLPNQTKLQIISEKDGWVEAYLPVSVFGWVQSENLDASNVVISTPCPVYTGPGVQFTTFYMAPEGLTLEGTNRKDGNWIRIRVPSDATGWIHKDYVCRGTPEAKKAPESAAKAAATENTANTALLQAQLNHENARRDEAQAKVRLAALERQSAEQEALKLTAETESARKEAQEKLQNLRKEMERLENERREQELMLASARENAKQKAEVARSEAATLEQEQALIEKRAQDTMVKIKSVKEQLNTSTHRHQELQDNLKTLQGEVTNVQSRIDALKLERQKKEEEAKLAGASIQTMHAKAQLLAEENKRMQETLAKTQAESDALQKRLAEAKQALQQQDADRARLQELQKELQNVKDTDAAMSRQLDETKSRIDAQNALHRQASEKLEQMKKDEAAAAERAQKAQVEMRLAQQKVEEDMKKIIQQAEADRRKADEHLAELKAEAARRDAEAKIAAKKAEEDRLDAERKLALLQEETARREADARAAAQKAENERKEADERLAALTAVAAKADAERKASEAKFEELKVETERRDAAAKAAQKKLEDFEAARQQKEAAARAAMRRYEGKLWPLGLNARGNVTHVLVGLGKDGKPTPLVFLNRDRMDLTVWNHQRVIIEGKIGKVIEIQGCRRNVLLVTRIQKK